MPWLFMDFIKAEMDKEFNAVGLRSLRKNLRVLPQVKVKENKSIDATRKALAPGKRISKTGKVYWETRSNRSDALGKKIWMPWLYLFNSLNFLACSWIFLW